MTEARNIAGERAAVWFCWVPKLDGDLATGNGGLYRAMTSAKAKYLCYLAAKDAGFETIGFPDIHVRRERAYDGAEFTSGSMPRYARLPPKGIRKPADTESEP